MNLESFSGPGSTPSRRRFWDQVTQAVLASQKLAGKNVTVSEHQSAGTLINVVGGRGRASGACCVDDVCSMSTAADCAAAGGTYQGDGTVCDPNPCGGVATGACCINGECSILSSDDCATASGYYFGDGSDCDPDPCPGIGCCFHTDEGEEFCITTTSTACVDLGGTGIGLNTFCWPSGNITLVGLASCCVIGDNECYSGANDAYFCCTPPNICCTSLTTGEPDSCCTPGTNTCCVGRCCNNITETCCEWTDPESGFSFGSCCSGGQTCDPSSGCIGGFSAFSDAFFQDN